VSIIAPGFVKETLDQGKSNRWGGGEPGAQPVCLRHQLAVVVRLPNESPGFGLIGGDRLGRERERAGAGGAE